MEKSKIWEKQAEFIHFVPYVNCPDLLEKAILSTCDTASKGIGVIIDNRSDLTLPDPKDIFAGKGDDCFMVFTPDVPLTTAQTMNLMKKLATEKACKFFTWIHGDGEVAEGSSLVLIDEVERANAAAEKWGCIFTLYDIYSAFNMEACRAVGDWDWLRFPYYFLDNDYYNRMRCAGYTCEEFDWRKKMNVQHHNGSSSTIKNDPVRMRVNDYLWPVQQRLFKEKYPNEI
jgi:hypothetical protein